MNNIVQDEHDKEESVNTEGKEDTKSVEENEEEEQTSNCSLTNSI